MATIGLIAGNGRFPFLVAEEIRRTGDRVVAFAIPDETDPALKTAVDVIHWVPLGQLQKLIDGFHAESISTAIMAGQVKHVQIFKDLSLDWRAVKLMARMVHRKTDGILGAVANELAAEGVTLLPSHRYLTRQMADKGLMAGVAPSGPDHDDVVFGIQTAKQLAGLDIGQTVVVRSKAVVAVESVEGTNECIRRGASLAGPGVVVAKVAKPNQDWRFDIPVIGSETIDVLAETHARLIAVEAGATLLLDKPAVIARARELAVTLIGV